MYLNFDVTREVLLYIEKNTKYVEYEGELQPMVVTLSQLIGENRCDSLAEALYIVRKLEEGGYIITTEAEKEPIEKFLVFKAYEEPLCVLDITFKGIEFLNLIRDDIVWDRYKHNFPAISFENITQIIPKIIIEYYL
ncbi:MAG: DUF2513 domain-containing protein [Ruminococcus sp.]|nr:DUF2513 domain-containing protein [Ruminococcus sp.]